MPPTHTLSSQWDSLRNNQNHTAEQIANAAHAFSATVHKLLASASKGVAKAIGWLEAHGFPIAVTLAAYLTLSVIFGWRWPIDFLAVLLKLMFELVRWICQVVFKVVRFAFQAVRSIFREVFAIVLMLFGFGRAGARVGECGGLLTWSYFYR